MAALEDLIRRMIRAELGLEQLPAPAIDRLAKYDATVKACASDGSTVDVEFDDIRLKSAQGLKVRAGVPGAVAVVAAGARVHVGWEGGNPAHPYAVPSWEAGASVTKLVMNAADIYLVAESGAVAAGKGPTLQDWVTEIMNKFNAHTHVETGASTDPPAPAQQISDKGAVSASHTFIK